MIVFVRYPPLPIDEIVHLSGLPTPLVVRPLENDEYEVISGHRRLHACQKAGIKTVPALIYALDRDAAAIALVDSNLHREKILPSEKAFAYKLKMDAMSRQGQRTDLTSRQVVGKLEMADLIAENESGRADFETAGSRLPQTSAQSGTVRCGMMKKNTHRVLRGERA